MNYDIIEEYSKENKIPIEKLKQLNEKLKIPEIKKLTSFAQSRRKESVIEAIKWKKGPDQNKREITKLYSINDYVIAVGKPGKEADPNYRRTKNYKTGEKTNNPNDMNPFIMKSDIKINKDYTFMELFETIEKIKHADRFGLELFGTLLFRMAFMLDHRKNENGDWRYSPPNGIIEEIEKRVPPIENIPIGVFIYFLEILSLNEDVKVCTLSRNPDLKEDYGRVNTLLTFVHLISVYLDIRSIAKFSGAFARPPIGMAPIPKKVALECFPLLLSNMFSSSDS